MTPSLGCLALEQEGWEFFEGLKKILPDNAVEVGWWMLRAGKTDIATDWDEVVPMTESFASAIDKALGEIQAWGIKIENPSQIKEYLTAFVDTIDLVVALSRRAAFLFLKNSTMTLDLFTLMDEGGSETYLRLLIRQWPYDSDLLDRIQQIYDEEVYLLANASGWYQVTTDFRKP